MVEPLRKHRAFSNKNEGLFNLSFAESILQYCLFEQLLNSMQHCKSQVYFQFIQLNPKNVFEKLISLLVLRCLTVYHKIYLKR